MTSLELALSNLASPPVLFFVLGVLAVAVRSDLELPQATRRWLALYLLFAIANRMLPSPADREPWKPVIIFLTILSVVVISAGWTLRITPEARNTILDVVGFLLYAFALTVATDVVVAMFLGLVESIALIIRRERVPY